jgi:hypothetical protein
MIKHIKVFECPECQGRVLKQIVHIPAVRTFDYLRDHDIITSDDADTTECTLEAAMDENYTDTATDENYVYCEACGKHWTSIGDGPESLEASGGLKTIPEDYYGKWLENEFEDEDKWTWEICESISDKDWLLIIRKNDEVEAMFRTCCEDLAGEWWYYLKWIYPTPEAFIYYADVELDIEIEQKEDWEELLESYHADGQYATAVRIVQDGEYNESEATPWSNSLYWEYTKQVALHTKGMDVRIVPAWAICYLVNGDMDNLTDEELQMARDWEKECSVLSVAPEHELITCPWTHLLSDCYEVTVSKLNNKDIDE